MKILTVLIATCTLALPASAVPQELDESVIGQVLIHPPYAETYACTEHYAGQLPHLGDALGTDCTIGRLVEENGRLWMRSYENAGLENHDWFGYGADVLAPCSCTVARININPVENEPGVMGDPPASWIAFERPDGTFIMIAHVRDVAVSEGEAVSAGDVVATVGNNGYSRQPHVHIGAWRDETPLQIRFDQTSMSGGE